MVHRRCLDRAVRASGERLRLSALDVRYTGPANLGEALTHLVICAAAKPRDAWMASFFASVRLEYGRCCRNVMLPS